MTSRIAIFEGYGAPFGARNGCGRGCVPDPSAPGWSHASATHKPRRKKHKLSMTKAAVAARGRLKKCAPKCSRRKKGSFEDCMSKCLRGKR